MLAEFKRPHDLTRLLRYGADHVFHMRYSKPEAVAGATMLTRAAGLMMEAADGRRIVNAIATHHNINLGHCHAELSRAIYDQLLTPGPCDHDAWLHKLAADPRD